MRVVGHRFSRETHELRDFLARNRVPARWLDIERDGEARELVAVAGRGARPAAGRAARGRQRARAAQHARDRRAPRHRRPAGARPLRPRHRRRRPGRPRRRGLRRLRGPAHGDGRARGGRRARPGSRASSRTTSASRAACAGSELASRATMQARRLGAELLTVQEAAALEVDGSGRFLQLTGGGTLSTNCVLVASGVAYRQLTAPGFDAPHRRRHLLRGRDDRGARVQGAARRRHRRRELGRPGGGALQRVRRRGDHARARRRR